MIIDRNENIFIVTQEKLSIIELVLNLEKMSSKYEHNNIIVNLSALAELKTETLIEFLKLSNNHRSAKHSFVIVAKNIDSDEIPDELIIVPTIQEAYDIIEMEEMERDLGF